MPGKPTNEAPTAPRRDKIKTPVDHERRDHTSGIDTVEGRQSSRNANIDAPQQKYRETPRRSRS
jgi:hypothetical protein